MSIVTVGSRGRDAVEQARVDKFTRAETGGSNTERYAGSEMREGRGNVRLKALTYYIYEREPLV